MVTRPNTLCWESIRENESGEKEKHNKSGHVNSNEPIRPIVMLDNAYETSQDDGSSAGTEEGYE